MMSLLRGARNSSSLRGRMRSSSSSLTMMMPRGPIDGHLLLQQSDPTFALEAGGHGTGQLDLQSIRFDVVTAAPRSAGIVHARRRRRGRRPLLAMMGQGMDGTTDCRGSRCSPPISWRCDAYLGLWARSMVCTPTNGGSLRLRAWSSRADPPPPPSAGSITFTAPILARHCKNESKYWP